MEFKENYVYLKTYKNPQVSNGKFYALYKGGKFYVLINNPFGRFMQAILGSCIQHDESFHRIMIYASMQEMGKISPRILRFLTFGFYPFTTCPQKNQG